MDGANFKAVLPGAPLFISTNGQDEVIAFDPPPASGFGPTPPPPPPLYTVFVNEAAYRERNIALALYEEKLKPSILPVEGF